MVRTSRGTPEGHQRDYIQITMILQGVEEVSVKGGGLKEALHGPMSNSFLDSGHNLSLVFGLVSVYTKENIKIVFRKQLLFCFFLVRGTRSAFRKL